MAEAERNALRVQGLNSKKLPLRPGVSPCGYYLRNGDCKYGKACKWDHPETQSTPGGGRPVVVPPPRGAWQRTATTNSKGYPMRSGEAPCAFYMRTGTCKFGPTCKFDHPAFGPDGGAGADAIAKTAAPGRQAEVSPQEGYSQAVNQPPEMSELELQQQALMMMGQGQGMQDGSGDARKRAEPGHRGWA